MTYYGDARKLEQNSFDESIIITGKYQTLIHAQLPLHVLPKIREILIQQLEKKNNHRILAPAQRILNPNDFPRAIFHRAFSLRESSQAFCRATLAHESDGVDVTDIQRMRDERKKNSNREPATHSTQPRAAHAEPPARAKIKEYTTHKPLKYFFSSPRLPLLSPLLRRPGRVRVCQKGRAAAAAAAEYEPNSPRFPWARASLALVSFQPNGALARARVCGE